MKKTVPSMNYLIEHTKDYTEGSIVNVEELDCLFLLCEGEWLQYIEEEF